MTVFDEWAKRLSSVRLLVGTLVLVMTTLLSLGVAIRGVIVQDVQGAMRLDRMEATQDTIVAVQDTVVRKLRRLEPNVAFLYCVARAEAEGKTVGPFTCDPSNEEAGR